VHESAACAFRCQIEPLKACLPGFIRETASILVSKLIGTTPSMYPEAWGCTSYAGAEIILWINGRDDQIEDAYCVTTADSYGCIVGANISNGTNTGFVGPHNTCITAPGKPEPGRLFPRISQKGDACVHATIDLHDLRKQRKHLRQMHQRRPELYGLLVQDVKIWQDYPDIPWIHNECESLTNKSQL
jgi:hypothetical protein